MKNAFQIALVLLSLTGVKAQDVWPDELSITPERSNFQKTSTYDDVIAFLKAIDAKSDQIHVTSMGESPEGRDIPVVVLSNPAVTSAAQAKASGKIVVYVQGNIHAGEVEGKEVVMMLIRDILLGTKQHLLKNQIILFSPIYNTDSNDKMEKGRRPSQEDSPIEVGIRENSQGLDLNRDGVKAEAPETKGLISNIVVPWDPQVFVDLHTTNGTWHGYSLTWAPSYHSAGEKETYEYTQQMLRTISSTMKSKYDLSTGPFGDFDVREGWPTKNFYTYNHHPRYLVNQMGLRNRMAILSEAFAHERFYQRIHSTYAFVNEILEYTNDHASEIRQVNTKAEAASIALAAKNGSRIKKGVRYKMVSTEILKDFKTYDYIGVQSADGATQWKRTGKIRLLDSVNYHASFEPQLFSTVPSGYVIPKTFAKVVDLLRLHGVQVSEVERSTTFTGEQFLATGMTPSQRKFEGHYMIQIDGAYKPSNKKFSKGDFVVDLAQPLANFIFFLLEPQSDDGLVNWNFFDEHFKSSGIDNKPVEYPVFKFYKEPKSK